LDLPGIIIVLSGCRNLSISDPSPDRRSPQTPASDDLRAAPTDDRLTLAPTGEAVVATDVPDSIAPDEPRVSGTTRPTLSLRSS